MFLVGRVFGSFQGLQDPSSTRLQDIIWSLSEAANERISQTYLKEVPVLNKGFLHHGQCRLVLSLAGHHLEAFLSSQPVPKCRLRNVNAPRPSCEKSRD